MKLKFKNIEFNKVFIKNFSALAIVQGLNYLLPLLTLPYLVKILGLENFGILALATSVVTLFAVITDYGFNFTATREISLFKSQKKEIVKIYSSVMILKFILMFVSFLILCILVFSVSKFREHSIIFLLSYGIVIGQVLFPVWFFQGMEQMQFITIVNIFSKIFSTACIFIFIYQPSDFYLVPIFMSLGSILGGIYSLYLISNDFQVSFEFQPKSELLKYLKDGFNIFSTSFLSTLLTSSGIIILGFYASNTTVGIYSAIEKLFRAIVGLFSPITQALYPISCKKLNLEKNNYFKKLFIVMLFLTLMIASIIFVLSDSIVKLLYSDSMKSYVYILQVMMIWLIFSVMNNVLGIQYLSAKRQDRYYLYAFICGALLTVLLNFVLIPPFLINGILCAMIVGEIALTVMMTILIKGKKL